MAKSIYVNLPVKDLNKTMEFFTKLGFNFNMQFTNHEAACLVIGENIFAMLLTEERFRDFTKKPISDAKKSTEVLIAIDVESREEVDKMIKKAVDAGGSIYRDPEDHGWMYYHSFADLDGHQWEIMHADLSKLPQEMTQGAQNT